MSAKYIPMKEGELATLLEHFTDTGIPICATFPDGKLIVEQSDPKVIEKLAEMRGIELGK